MSVVAATQFSDPIMGLSWECEPPLRQVETHFGKQAATRDAMGLLVRDVADFMTREERALPEAEGLTRYNERIAQVYLQEEPIASMPINMGDFCLFAPDRRSSLPLCLAYEAVVATRPELAATFLCRLRYATVVECRPTCRIYTSKGKDTSLTRHEAQQVRHTDEVERLRGMASHARWNTLPRRAFH